MSMESGKDMLRCSKRALYKVRETLILKRKSNWECISKPLDGNPNDLGNIHSPTIEEFGMTCSVGGKTKSIHAWWYSAVLNDEGGELCFFIRAFHPKWSMYRIVHVDSNQIRDNAVSLSYCPTIGSDFNENIGYLQREDEIDLWVPRDQDLRNVRKHFASCVIRVGGSHLTLKTDEESWDLAFASLGIPIWINRGREAVCSPKGGTMSGFWGVSKVEGYIDRNGRRAKVTGVGYNEHLMSLTRPELFWDRIDGVFLYNDKLYCAFWYLEKKIGSRRYEYKDGAIVIRATNDYLIPTNFNIEYLRFDKVKRIPIEIKVRATTTKGELEVVAQALVETEKQLALRMRDGTFVFKDGKELKLGNGFGQHSLH